MTLSINLDYNFYRNTAVINLYSFDDLFLLNIY